MNMPKSWWFLTLIWLGILAFSSFSWCKTLVYSVSVGGQKVGTVTVDFSDDGKVFYYYTPVPEISTLQPSILYLGDRQALKRTVAMMGRGCKNLLPVQSANIPGRQGYREPSEPSPFGLVITYFHIGSLVHLFTMNTVAEFTIDSNGVISGQKLTVSNGGVPNGKHLLNGSVLLTYALAENRGQTLDSMPSFPVQYAFLEVGIAEGYIMHHGIEPQEDDGVTHKIKMIVQSTAISFRLQLNSDGVIQTLIMTMPDGKNTVRVNLENNPAEPDQSSSS